MSFVYERGTGKLSFWENDIYVVASCDLELPNYQITPENGRILVKTVHRNLLLKCNKLPLDIENLDFKKSASKTSLLRKTSYYNLESENESESDTEFVLINKNIQKPTSSKLGGGKETRNRKTSTSNINETTYSLEHET